MAYFCGQAHRNGACTKRRCWTLKQPKLQITFHNPNTTEELAKALIVLAAEAAKGKVTEAILHIEENKEAEQG